MVSFIKLSEGSLQVKKALDTLTIPSKAQSRPVRGFRKMLRGVGTCSDRLFRTPEPGEEA